MAKDAFGNPTGGGVASPSPTPTAAEGPGGPGRDGLPGGVLLLLLVVLSLAGSAFVLVSEERANRDDPVQAAQRGEISTLDARSLLMTSNLERAWAAARRELSVDEVVLELRVSPVGLAVTVRDGEERQRQLAVDVAFVVRSLDRGESSRDGVAAAGVPITAVARAALGVLDRAGPRARVDAVRSSITATRSGDPANLIEWIVDVEGVRLAQRTWFASPDGSRVRLSSEPREITQEPAP